MPYEAHASQTLKKLEEENKQLLSEKQELKHQLRSIVYGSPVQRFS